MLNNDALLTLGVAVGSGEGSTSTVGGGGRVFGRGPCRRTGVQAGRVVCRVYTWRAVEGRYVVNAEGFWAKRGIFCSAFTRGMHRLAFSCKRGKVEGHGSGPNGPRGWSQRAIGWGKGKIWLGAKRRRGSGGLPPVWLDEAACFEAKRRRGSGGLPPVNKTRNGVQVQGPKLRFCGADEARKST